MNCSKCGWNVVEDRKNKHRYCRNYLCDYNEYWGVEE